MKPFSLWIFALMIAALACAGSQTKPGTLVTGFTADMLPMTVGNTWTYTYRGMPREPQTVEIKIDDAQDFNGKKYYHFTGWFSLTLRGDQGGVWLRHADGAIWMRTDSHEEKAVGTGLDNTELTVAPEDYETADGTVARADAVFRTCVRCADAGGPMYFVRGKGVVLVGMSAIWGGASYKLIKADLK